MRDKVKKFLGEYGSLILYGILLVFVGSSIKLGYQYYSTRDTLFERYDKVEVFCGDMTKDIESDIEVRVMQDTILHIRNNTVEHSYYYGLRNVIHQGDGFWVLSGAVDQLYIQPSQKRIMIKSPNGCVYVLSNNKSVKPNGRALPEGKRREELKEQMYNSSSRVQRVELDIPSFIRERG